MLCFATLFDFNYLSRGLSLYKSLKKNLNNEFTLFVLCLDEETQIYFEKNQFENIIAISLDKVENDFLELIIAKENRTKVEYYFTLSPIWPLYILKRYPDCNRITTIDADLYFFSSPKIIFDSYDKDSILITPHDFSSDLTDLNVYGKYNVSFQSFPNNENGRRILNDWKDKCIDWCSDYLDTATGYFADQKYLDEWEVKYENVKPINLKIAGRAPWNIKDTEIKLVNNTFVINKKPLVYYHFHHFRINHNVVSTGLNTYKITNVTSEVKYLYNVYIKAITSFNNFKTNNDINIKRFNSQKNKNLIVNLWNVELGAILIGKKTLHFNIITLKKKLSYYKKKLMNGKIN